MFSSYFFDMLLKVTTYSSSAFKRNVKKKNKQNHHHHTIKRKRTNEFQHCWAELFSKTKKKKKESRTKIIVEENSELCYFISRALGFIIISLHSTHSIQMHTVAHFIIHYILVYAIDIMCVSRYTLIYCMCIGFLFSDSVYMGS